MGSGKWFVLAEPSLHPREMGIMVATLQDWETGEACRKAHHGTWHPVDAQPLVPLLLMGVKLVLAWPTMDMSPHPLKHEAGGRNACSFQNDFIITSWPVVLADISKGARAEALGEPQGTGVGVGA